MLQITIPATEMFDEKTNTFVSTKERTLQLEHSLVSISKWESKWHKAFLGKQGRTDEEVIDYIKCMTITQNVPDEVYACLTPSNIEAVKAYIEAPMTATHFRDDGKGGTSNETVTSELIYYWMIHLNIPDRYDKWHLNRLLTLIKVINKKEQPAKPMGKGELASRNHALNAARKKKYNTRG